MDGKRNGTSDLTDAQVLRDLFSSLLKEDILDDLKRHGNCSWDPKLVVIQAILVGMSRESNLTLAHDDAMRHCKQLFGDVGARSYQAMMNILLSYSPELLERVQEHLRSQMASAAHSRIDGYFPLAVDGSKPSAPRTRSNEKRFISARYGNGKNAKHRKRSSGKKKPAKQAPKKKRRGKSQPTPNVLVTKLMNLALQLPWHWTIGGVETDERSETAAMVKTLKFPENTLIVADAGFVGYELWTALLEANLTFLVRAGSNVYLKPKNVKKGLYYYRPKRWAGQPPIVVRLVYIKIGKTKMAMLTNELDPCQLSKALIKKLYRMRWSVEVDFRDFKQTFNRKKFRCKQSDRVIIEATWSMLTFTLMKWWTRQHIPQRRETQHRASFAKAIRAFQRALTDQNSINKSERNLQQNLREAVIDSYTRNKPKAARYKPVGERPRTGLPKIQLITQAERKALEKRLRLAI